MYWATKPPLARFEHAVLATEWHPPAQLLRRHLCHLASSHSELPTWLWPGKVLPCCLSRVAEWPSYMQQRQPGYTQDAPTNERPNVWLDSSSDRSYSSDLLGSMPGLILIVFLLLCSSCSGGSYMTYRNTTLFGDVCGFRVFVRGSGFWGFGFRGL